MTKRAETMTESVQGGPEERQPFEIWVVYANPSDMPGLFVARRWLASKATDMVHPGATLDEVRGKLPPDRVCIPRFENDEPTIVETWM